MTHKRENLTVSVIGLGYIGLPTAAMFASRKIRVVGVDVNPATVETVNQGRVHIVEPELDMIVQAAVSAGYLKATTTPEPADAFLIAVPTPFKQKAENGQDPSVEPDISFVQAACEAIAPVLKKGDCVILESTSPIGTTEQMLAVLQTARPDLAFPSPLQDTTALPDIHMAYCPERVLPGHIVRELVQNDRILGGITPACSARARQIYEIFVEGDMHTATARTAELAKLAENTFRDINIAYANELSMIADRLDIDVWDLIRLANRHPRVNILQPGAGVGGHCIAVDPWFIVSSAPQEAQLTRAARQVNKAKPAFIVGKVTELFTRYTADRAHKKIAVLGLAFKPDIDDLRESPALEIANSLSRLYPGQLLCVEPHIDTLPQSLSGNKLVSLKTALQDADVIVVLVAHKDFKRIPKSSLEGKPLLDAAGIYQHI